MARFIYDRAPEEQQFQPSPVGWIFTIGGRWSYRVDDAQKAALLRRLARWRFVPPLLLIIVIVGLMASGIMPGSGASGWNRVTVLAVVSLVVASLMLIGIPHFQLFVLRPILATAEAMPPAPAAIAETFRGGIGADVGREARTYSLTYLVIACLLFGAFSIKAAYAAVAADGSIIYCLGTLVLTAYFLAVLVAKLRQRRSPQ